MLIISNGIFKKLIISLFKKNLWKKKYKYSNKLKLFFYKNFKNNIYLILDDLAFNNAPYETHTTLWT